MAIDFPNSPTVGQIYTASNGIVYVYNGTLWTASSAASSAGGDFYATNGTNLTLAVPATLIVLNTVRTGNAGGWYNASTGRFTPPAGRYFISVQLSCSNSGAAVTVTTELRKNGVLYAYNIDGSTTGLWAQPSVQVTVDSNGTDYWELWGNSNSSSTSASGHFTAFPVSGIKGPPGDPGQLGFRLLQRTVVSSAVADVSIQNIPADINDLKFTFDLTPVTNAVHCYIQFYDGAGALVSTGYGWNNTTAHSAMTGAGAPAVTSSVAASLNTGIVMNFTVGTRLVGNVNGIKGNGTMSNIRSTTRTKSCEWMSTYVSDDAVVLCSTTGSGHHGTARATTGFRIVFSAGNVASGAFSVWGSP